MRSAARDSGGESAYDDVDERPAKPPRKKARKSGPVKEGADGSPAGSATGTPAKGKAPTSKRKGPKSAASGLKITCHNCASALLKNEADGCRSSVSEQNQRSD